MSNVNTHKNIYRGREFTIGEEVELQYSPLQEDNEENKLIFDKFSDIKSKIYKLNESIPFCYKNDVNEIGVILDDLESRVSKVLK